MKIKSQKDFFAGLMFTAIGGAFGVGATSYNVGEGARMGPGYFPLLLGVLLAVLGAVIILRALIVETEDGEPVGAWAWKPLFHVIAANLAFGVLLAGLPGIEVPAMGMIAAIYALTLISARAGEDFRLGEVLILATILSVGSYLCFIVLLKLQIQVWPTFIPG